MKHFLTLYLFILSGQLFSQEIKDPINFLATVGRKILEHPEYEERKAANDTFQKVLANYLGSDAGFDDPLTPVTNMMRLELGEDARIYTWQMPDENYDYIRYGFVAAKSRGDVVLTQLVEKPSVRDLDFRILKPDEWYGAIYYEAIPVEEKKKEVYTLLGFAPGKPVNQKIIDVIEIDRRGHPRFGAKVFYVEEFMDKTFNKPPMRLVLEYNGDYAASVRWNEVEEMIVMDHLAPPDVKLKGVYRTYGPDMSYDALEWKKDWWHLKKEVEFNSRQDIKITPPDKPVDPPPRSGRRPEPN